MQSKLGVVALAVSLVVFAVCGSGVVFLMLVLRPGPVTTSSAVRPAVRSSRVEPVPASVPPTPSTGGSLRPLGDAVAPTLVAGTVTGVNTTGFAERVYWDVPSGLTYAYVEQDGERIVCVFRGGLPAGVQPGSKCRLEGRERGRLPTSGLHIVVDCRFAASGDDDR